MEQESGLGDSVKTCIESDSAGAPLPLMAIAAIRAAILFSLSTTEKEAVLGRRDKQNARFLCSVSAKKLTGIFVPFHTREMGRKRFSLHCFSFDHFSVPLHPRPQL